MKRFWPVVTIVLLSGLLVSCNAKKDPVAKVGGEIISLQELNSRIATYPAQYQQALQTKENKEKILDQLVNEKLIVIAAKKAGIEKTDEYKTLIESAQDEILRNLYLKQEILSGISVTPKDIETFYQNNYTQFEAKELRDIRHILLNSESEANRIRLQVLRGADFAALAKEVSIDTQTKANGGEIGFVSRDQLAGVPALQEAVFSLTKSRPVSSVVKTAAGFHVVKLEDIQIRKAIPLEQVSGNIEQALANQRYQAKLQENLEKLKKSVKVTKDTALLAPPKAAKAKAKTESK